MGLGQTFVKMAYFVNSNILIILAIIFIKLTIGLGASVNAETQAFETNVCTTPACLRAAESIKQNMNIKKNPCGNFYLFACGKFVKQADVPHGQPYTNPIKIIENEIKEKLKNDLESKIEDNEPRIYQVLKTYYASCLDSGLGAENTSRAYKSIIELILENLGGWPVLEGNDWDESEFNWLSFIEQASKLGLIKAAKSFINLNKKPEKKNSLPLIFLDRPITEIDRSILIEGLKNNQVKKYYDSMVELALLYGADKSEATEELKKSLMFEIELAKIQQNSIHSYTLDELERTDETFPWREYLNQYLPENNDFDTKEKVMVDLASFRSLMQLIENTETRTIANYALWRVVQELHDILDVDFTMQYFVAPKTGHPLWKYCINYLMINMPVAMGALYVDKHFNKSSKSGVEEITTNLLKTFARSISKAKSMSNETRSTATKKLELMQIQVGYPDELVDDAEIEDYFENLHNPGPNFLENHLALTAFNFRNDFERMIHANDWVDQASVAKPHPINNYKRNSIIINAAILQKEFFDANVPNYLNYAGIGRVIGHEITHAFDNHGSKFDERGIYKDWLVGDVRREFKNTKRCLAKQYSNYNASKRAIALKGEFTLHENIADHGGIKMAYAAYEEWIKQNGEEPVLPGLSYTPQQLFWLNVAHTECSRIRRKGWDVFLELDNHSPGPFRVLGPLANMPEFARDFNCPTGSRMNPTEKCSFWWND